MTHQVPAISRLSNRILAVAFLLAVTLPMFGVMRDGVEEQLAETERRKPAEFPVVELKDRGWISTPKSSSLRKFPRRFEAWFNDRIPTRESLLATYNSARYLGLISDNFGRPSVGTEAKRTVVIGLNGWLYYRAEKSIEYFRGTNPFTPEELDTWVRVLRARRDWLKARGIKYVLIIAPNKHTIYPEHMPRSLTRVSDRSRWDALIAALKGPDGVDVIDLRPALRRAKRSRPTYFKTDTHWNEYGAFVACQEIVRHLRTHFPDLRTRSLDEYRIDESPFPDGDLAKMIRSPFPYRDSKLRLIPRSGGERKRIALSQLHGAESGRETIVTNPNPALPRTVILHDSFMSSLAPFLSEHWSRARYRSTHVLSTKMIEEEKPAIVIQELVERVLSREPYPDVAAVRALERR